LKAFRALAVATAAAAFLLIVIGALVRVSGSGLGCGNDWPLCHGAVVPLFDLHTFIEWSHRQMAGIVSILSVATALYGWLKLRGQRTLVWLATGTVGLVVLQALLGAAVVKGDLASQLVMAHLAAASLTFAATLVLVTLTGAARVSRTERRAAARLYSLSFWTTVSAFLLLMSGALVTGSGAASACPDWPLCFGLSIPAAGLPAIHFAHRLVVLAVGTLIVYTAIAAMRRSSAGAGGVACWLLVFLAGQVIVGALQVWTHFPPGLVALHISLAEAVWGSLAIMTVLAYRERQAAISAPPSGGLRFPLPVGEAEAEAEPQPVSAGGFRQTLLDYLALTKPEIISLLLLTTVCTMFIATRDMPSPWLILWTTLGGALAAGGANALNCYVDQDIDQEMTRTRRRPLPAGRMQPANVLVFGLALGVLSFMVMLLGVNMLAAVLSLAGLLFYVFVYTLWLKRSTPQNIVIGGAAGAVPPLVGWAAVTGHVDLAAWWLFAIIFFWTPPHFWALALLIKKDYMRAGVPMLPVVSSEDNTRRQILLYALLLLPLTVMLFAIGALGIMYLVLALGLTGVFVWYAARLWRQATLGWARRTYRYSLLYLALLFAAMVLDHAVSLTV
jgi:protoheme IX farnesyltransferase